MSWHEIINVILFNIKSILKITILSAVFLFLILLLVYPRTYRADASIMPPEKQEGFGGLSSLLSGGNFSSILTGGMATATSQLYVEILKSRSAALNVVDKLNLTKLYDADDRIEAAEKLVERLHTDISKEGIITISVDVKSSLIPLLLSDEDSLKTLSAVISNTYIEALDSINKEKLSSKAKSARQYIQEQIVQTKALLDSAETALMKFQSKNKTIALTDQIKAAIEGSAQLKTEIMKTEIELGLIKTDAGESSRLYNSLNKKLQELRAQYSKFETGSTDYLLAFKDVPVLGKELAGLLREVRIQNEVYVLLQQQYYQEKIQENKDIPTAQVLDEAIPPKKKSEPKIVLSTLTGSILIMMICIFILLISNKKKYMN
ncbi:MAG TPA: GNVR domain-containing protein [Ignavibacteriaceae bacterium]|nr:GNVR domain-containing protein [Ignavibacteriaceae bacterium]HQI41324.1 GNVR domain-containing protein [Ignavibacteriaceae bacterium]